MRTVERPRGPLALALGMCLGLAGCSTASAPAADTPTPVAVAHPVEQEVTEYSDATGRTVAVESVEIRARVWGYIDRVNFKEGLLVKKGDILFEIDPRTYRAALTQAEGNLASAEAKANRLEADLRRAQNLLASRAISREDFDRVLGDRQEAAASIGALKGAVEQARLDLEYTRVRAPVDGRVGRAIVTVGNLVQSGQTGGTLLTTLVSVDPIYVYFDVDEHTVLRVREMIRAGRVKSARDGRWPVFLGLANEAGYPHAGTIDFVDNQVNPRTGTLRLRGVIPNKDEELSPGYFARVRVPIGPPYKAVLVNERAIDVDQGQKVVYVVNEQGKVAARPVRVGMPSDGLRVIAEGLSPGDRVIINGLQQVRPGMAVEPSVVTMPRAPAGMKSAR